MISKTLESITEITELAIWAENAEAAIKRALQYDLTKAMRRSDIRRLECAVGLVGTRPSFRLACEQPGFQPLSPDIACDSSDNAASDEGKVNGQDQARQGEG